MKLNAPPTLLDIQTAHERVAPFIHRTPLLSSEQINHIASCEILFKCENFQKVGAFKIRGATNAILARKQEVIPNGVVCHSSGNHGQAVAKAAQQLGINSYVVMPHNANKIKIEAVKGYGATVYLCEPNDEAREEKCKMIALQEEAIIIHPFSDYDIIAGQATASKEVFEDTNDVAAILVPTGGGGLSAGTCLTTHYLSPSTQVYLTEPEQLDDTFRSFIKGEVVPNTSTDSLADGLKTTVGKINFEIIKQHAKKVLTVTEEEIIKAMQLIWERMKIIVEPSSAVPLAAVLKNKSLFQNKKIVIIITGGNVDLKTLPFGI